MWWSVVGGGRAVFAAVGPDIGEIDFCSLRPDSVRSDDDIPDDPLAAGFERRATIRTVRPRADRGWTAHTETREVVTVAGYQAIGEVGQTLVAMLQDRLREHWNAQLDDKVILAPPTVADEDTRPWLTLYLYHVEANAHQSNAPRREVTPGSFRDPPLALDLYYLLTAFPDKADDLSERTEETVKQHKILGEAMQTMADNAILRGPDLSGSIADDEEVRIVLHPAETDEVMSIWNTFEKRPYEPSVAYVIGPVLVESTNEAERERVRLRQLNEYLGPVASQEGDDE